MSFNEDEELEVGFKGGADDDEIGEPLDMPEEMSDFDMDEEDPDKDK